MIMNYTKLKQLQRQLETAYYFYRSGAIGQQEYQRRAKPLDMQITQLEMSTLQDTSVWIEAFLRSTLKQVR